MDRYYAEITAGLDSRLPCHELGTAPMPHSSNATEWYSPNAMSVAIRAEADGGCTRLIPSGTFDLAHASAVMRAVEQAERDLIASGDVDLHLSALERIDGSGAVLLARLIDRLEARGLRTRLIEDHNPHAVRLITLYRERQAEARPQPARRMGLLARLGVVAAAVPGMATGALDFLGQCRRSAGFSRTSSRGPPSPNAGARPATINR